MPFKSKAQKGYMFVHHPQIAKRWAHEYGVPKILPEHVAHEKAQRKRNHRYMNK